MDVYQRVIRPLLFSGLKADPEQLHHQSMAILGWLSAQRQTDWGRWMLRQLHQRWGWTDARLSQTIGGLAFPNPLGLAAGFDKDGIGAAIWGSFGFGFAELGTVTQHAQPGNPRPRLFRLLQDQGALNRMGFNNAGSAALASRLSQLQLAHAPLAKDTLNDSGTGNPIPLGINLGKSKITPLAEAAEDYLVSFRRLKALGDYFVVNVSSPNTPGLRSLQAIDQLEPILANLQQENRLALPAPENPVPSTYAKPLFLKIAPDLAWDDIAAITDLAERYELAGIIATNTTIRRDGLKTTILPVTGKPITEEAGGISGAPLRQASTEVIRFIWQQTQGRLPIIGVGGIFTAADAWEKITAGACLLQVYTGWIYEGPWMVQRVLQGLGDRLTQHGLTNISQAIGIGDVD